MGAVTISISGMTCGHCVSSVRAALEALPGVAVQHIGVGSAELRTDGPETSTDAIVAAVQDAGYDATLDVAAPAGALPSSTPAQSAPAGCACCAPSAAGA